MAPLPPAPCVNVATPQYVAVELRMRNIAHAQSETAPLAWFGREWAVVGGKDDILGGKLGRNWQQQTGLLAVSLGEEQGAGGSR